MHTLPCGAVPLVICQAWLGQATQAVWPDSTVPVGHGLSCVTVAMLQVFLSADKTLSTPTPQYFGTPEQYDLSAEKTYDQQVSVGVTGAVRGAVRLGYIPVDAAGVPDPHTVVITREVPNVPMLKTEPLAQPSHVVALLALYPEGHTGTVAGGLRHDAPSSMAVEPEGHKEGNVQVAPSAETVPPLIKDGQSFVAWGTALREASTIQHEKGALVEHPVAVV